jgi:hypothetical protein
MVRLSNKIACLFLLVFSLPLLAQQKDAATFAPNDYKDPAQFEKFKKKKNAVANWQINELKQGAIVVRLKTNKKLIDDLVAQGKTELALEKEKEQHVINANTYYAYKDYLKFCKVYFILSNSSDTLLNGARSGIFVDSTLKVNPSITMNEKFYLLAERDYGYNSSIGFVAEDTARKVVEGGNPVREMAIVLKNKYGHQLKGPFPYCVKEKNFMDALYEIPVNVDGTAGNNPQISYTVNRTYLEDIKERDKGKAVTVKTKGNSVAKIKKQFTYEKIALAVDELNDSLERFYRSSPKQEADKIDPSLKPFLY